MKEHEIPQEQELQVCSCALLNVLNLLFPLPWGLMSCVRAVVGVSLGRRIQEAFKELTPEQPEDRACIFPEKQQRRHKLHSCPETKLITVRTLADFFIIANYFLVSLAINSFSKLN